MELSDIENKLAASRRFFNATTTEYNTYIEMFPASIIA
jgi:LemA protein